MDARFLEGIGGGKGGERQVGENKEKIGNF
jgi:hypothetical protein